MAPIPRGEVSDEELMSRYVRGERDAFAALVRRHKAPLYNFVLRHVHAPATAEDIVQEVFVRVVQRATEFKQEARFTTWLYTIARNLCIDHLRKMAHRRHASLDRRDGGDTGDGPSLGERTADRSPSATVDRAAIGHEVGERIARAVEELPEEQREVFLLREIACLPFKEIAVITGTPENTVKSRMRYALERLQGALVDFEEYARTLR